MLLFIAGFDSCTCIIDQIEWFSKSLTLNLRHLTTLWNTKADTRAIEKSDKQTQMCNDHIYCLKLSSKEVRKLSAETTYSLPLELQFNCCLASPWRIALHMKEVDVIYK
jgi:hypothetical protein